MSTTIVLLLLASVALSTQTAVVVQSTLFCFSSPYWCATIEIFELDNRESEFLTRSETFCSQNRFVLTRRDTVRADIDEDLNLELYSKVSHNCSTDGRSKIQFKFISNDIPYDLSEPEVVSATINLDAFTLFNHNS